MMEENMYLEKWLAINKEGSYYYCTDSDKSLEISKNKIYDHTPVEDSDFSIDHIKSIKNQTYLYLDNQESSYYILKWVDKEKGIISIKLNNYDTKDQDDAVNYKYKEDSTKTKWSPPKADQRNL